MTTNPTRNTYTRYGECTWGIQVPRKQWLLEHTREVFGDKCLICRKPSILLHHVYYDKDSYVGTSTYWRRWEAYYHPERFKILCRKCHTVVHYVIDLNNEAGKKLIDLAKEDPSSKQNHLVNKIKRDRMSSDERNEDAKWLKEKWDREHIADKIP